MIEKLFWITEKVFSCLCRSARGISTSRSSLATQCASGWYLTEDFPEKEMKWNKKERERQRERQIERILKDIDREQGCVWIGERAYEEDKKIFFRKIFFNKVPKPLEP